MIEPSNNDIKKEKQAELDRIAETNAKCIAGYQVVRKTIFEGIADAELEAMNKYIVAEYGKIYANLRNMIVETLNMADERNKILVEKLLNVKLPKTEPYKVLPNTSAFKFTNRVFTEKSISFRSEKTANLITKIIADGRNDGLAIPEIQKKIDVIMGFRDKAGKLTNKSKALIESGKFSHRNGSIYETYRIARTETMRMNAYAKFDRFNKLKKEYPNTRLKLIATIDGRERTQSREMNGFLSDVKGEFIYPDMKLHKLGQAPARYCINDRETQVIVFLEEKEIKNEKNILAKQKEKVSTIENAP